MARQLLAALLAAAACGVCCAQQRPGEAFSGLICADPSKDDPIVGFSDLFGEPKPNDTVLHDQLWAFSTYGPLSKLTLFKAWFYDGVWHDPGEFKGLQAWYGRGPAFTDPQALLMGARRPHVPKNCSLYREEGIVRAELQWDGVLRWANFSTNLGRYCAWGFPGVAGAQRVVVEAPAPGAYVAAFVGTEGKPMPEYSKRYLATLGFVWARRSCRPQGTGQAGVPAGSGGRPLEEARQGAASAPPPRQPAGRAAGDKAAAQQPKLRGAL